MKTLDEETLLQVFEGVPQFEVSKVELEDGIPVIDLLTQVTAVFPSKGEMRKMVQAGGVMINKNKLENSDEIIDHSYLIDGKYILAQKGKKNYYLLIAK